MYNRPCYSWPLTRSRVQCLGSYHWSSLWVSKGLFKTFVLSMLRTNSTHGPIQPIKVVRIFPALHIY